VLVDWCIDESGGRALMRAALRTRGGVLLVVLVDPQTPVDLDVVVLRVFLRQAIPGSGVLLGQSELDVARLQLPLGTRLHASPRAAAAAAVAVLLVADMEEGSTRQNRAMAQRAGDIKRDRRQNDRAGRSHRGHERAGAC